VSTRWCLPRTRRNGKSYTLLLDFARAINPYVGYRRLYQNLDYALEDVEVSAGAKVTLSGDKASVLMGRMRSPSLSLHGIEGAFYGAGAKTVIPAKVAGKFSIRLVPPQTPEKVDPLVIKYLHDEFAKLGSKNTMSVENLHGGKPWVEDYKHWNYEAAHRATEVPGPASIFCRNIESVYFIRPCTIKHQTIHARVVRFP
jgi:acetylornithine deacetylase/succinyl-diaminopimelate desuccinylase-like protein